MCVCADSLLLSVLMVRTPTEVPEKDLFILSGCRDESLHNAEKTGKFL